MIDRSKLNFDQFDFFILKNSYKVTLTNSEDPDEISLSVAFYHYLLR